jgi:predicted ATPase
VILCGEPGIGKSRLVQVVKDSLARTPHRDLECRCSPFYTHTPLYPVIELRPRVFDWKREDSPEIKFVKLQKGLAQYGLVLPETLSLFASLLSLPAELCDPLPPMTPERQKRRTLETIVELLLAMAADRPLLLIVEDLHWIDPTTLELLTLVLDQTPTARLLVLLTARPSFVSPWPARSHLTSLTVTRLTRKQAGAMVAQVAGRKALPAEVLQQIMEKTDGVPLFVEQLTKMVLESGLLSEGEDRYELSGPLQPLAIPSTLRDSLVARLDRLAPIKEVGQLGATLGRTFSYELIRAVSPLDDPALNEALSRLTEAQLLYQRGVPPKATYTFQHALIQEAAYRSLLRSTRRQYHQRIAQVLIERAREEIEATPELLAHHLTEAGLTQEAIEHWTRAGQSALQRSAIPEAIVHFNKGVGLLALLPESEIRARLELPLRLGLGPALLARHGYSSVEVAQAFARAQELCEQLGDTVQLFFALVGQYYVHIVRANLPKARQVAERSLHLAEQLDNRQLLMLAHHMIGALLHWNGRFLESRRMLETALRLHNPQIDGSLAARFGTDVGSVDRAYMGWNLWAFGYAEQSAVYMAEAVDLAKDLGHAPTLAHCLVLATGLCVLRRDAAAAREQAQGVISYARAQGFAYWEACGLVYQGWALSQTGCADEGLASIQDGLGRFRAMGASLSVPWALVLLAECFAAAGQLDHGLQSSLEALEAIERADTRLCESEAHRIRGELLLEHSAANAEQAEHCFHEAIAVARSQSAKLYELRAAVSLARLWQHKGKRAEAHSMLCEICAWFTEGFGIAELQRAKTLLEELSGSGVRDH